MPAVRSRRASLTRWGLVAAILALPPGTAIAAAPLFDPLPRTAVGLKPLAVAAGDFDGDIRPDLAVANHDSNTVSILPGRGNGSFQNAIPLPVGDGPCAVAAADFNGDGRLDLAIVNQDSDDVSILLGRFDGSFEPETSYGVGTAPSAIAIGLF
ncbi:MAG TPA: VCBS repeat-containing protein, partial [Candidatus Polarisedimenticolia bacterium]|nr:VCBS repeat-containing protein [Candidatus Polarisedimenticolia bacterium]